FPLESGRMSARSGIELSTSSFCIFGSLIESTKYGPRVTSVADSHAAVPLEVDPVPDPEPVELELLVVVAPLHPARNCARAAIVPLANTAPPTRITSLLERLFILSILRLDRLGCDPREAEGSAQKSLR